MLYLVTNVAACLLVTWELAKPDVWWRTVATCVVVAGRAVDAQPAGKVTRTAFLTASPPGQSSVADAFRHAFTAPPRWPSMRGGP